MAKEKPENALLDIQKQGAQARAMGFDELDNPYLKQKNLPPQTGETIEEWNEKATAWQIGFLMESAMRG